MSRPPYREGMPRPGPCPGPRRLVAAGAVAGLVALATGCGGSGPPAAGGAAGPSVGSGAPTSTPPLVARALPSCPPAPAGDLAFPPAVPQDLPKPPGSTLSASRTTPEGLTLVQFTTATSLREGVVFLVKALPETGYTIGRGDAEATEADAPFVKGDLRGVYRIVAREPCASQWLLAVTRRNAGGGSPLLPMRSSAPATPLPFG